MTTPASTWLRLMRIAKLSGGIVIADQSKALALAQPGDQFAALRRSAVVDGSEFDVFHVRAQRKSQQQELQSGRQNQRKGQTPVAPDLAQLLADQRADTMIEDLPSGL